MDDKGKIAEIQRMIERAQKGDLNAMTVLVEEHQGAVHGFLAQLIGDADAAKDLTQEAFVKAFKERWEDVFPAGAGMNRFFTFCVRSGKRVPRRRGDEPQRQHRFELFCACSPQARG